MEVNFLKNHSNYKGHKNNLNILTWPHLLTCINHTKVVGLHSFLQYIYSSVVLFAMAPLFRMNSCSSQPVHNSPPLLPLLCSLISSLFSLPHFLSVLTHHFRSNSNLTFRKASQSIPFLWIPIKESVCHKIPCPDLMRQNGIMKSTVFKRK